MKKVLITGGNGFGGSGLTKKLLENGYEVRVIDIISPNHADLLRKEIDEGLIDYRWKAVHDINEDDLKNVDIVCHFAAQADVPMGFTSPKWTYYENTEGTAALFNVLKDVKIEKVIIPSSGNVMGRPLYTPIDEKHPLTPHNPYSASKATQEMIAFAYYRSYGVPIVIFRNGIVYGPNMRRDIFIFKWFKELLQGKDIVLEGGDQTRDPCYVTDTIDAWFKAVEAPVEKVVGEIFQVSTGKEWLVREIAVRVIEIAGRGKIIQGDYRPGEKGQRECFDISKAKKILKYHPQIGLEEGLVKTYNWMKGLGL